MSSTIPTYSGDPPRMLPVERSEQFIDRQLRKTRRQVKLVDLAVALVQFAAGLLTSLLLLILVDHWVFGLGFWSRSLAFLGLIVGAGWFITVRLAPLLVRPISALYAAHTVEQSAPTLKNSLINFLLFRAQPATIHPGVYEALQDRAALDLRQVPLEIAVDRTRLIRVGYVLAGISAVCAIYTILSPKDPFQTVKRVTAPWADIARPARVTIEDVRPGDSDVYQGQPVAVSAIIRGVASHEQVSLVYTTADSQAVELPLAMQVDDSGLRHEAALRTQSGGIQQDVTYRIRAGDAVSRAYRLRVSPAPVIRVERVDYSYPPYMKRGPHSVQDDGHLKAPEGTRVTVHAHANYPIRSATVEFDPVVTNAPATDTVKPASARLPMDFQATAAKKDWVLELLPDRRTPQHASYQITFVNSQGQSSEKPLLHPIEVLPDLGPEIEILTPEKDRTELPADAVQKIEVRALDPDFGLSAIRLRAVVGGVEVLQENLFADPAGRAGQLIAQFLFQPVKLGLAAGDDVVFWAVAEDNRTAPGSLTAAPNVERTRNYHLRIVAPEKRSDPTRDPDGSAKPEPRKPDSGDSAQDSQDGPGSGQQGSEGSRGASGEQGAQAAQPGQGASDSSESQPPSESQSMEKGPGSEQGSGASPSEPADAPPSSEPNQTGSRRAGESGTESGASAPNGDPDGTTGEGPPRDEPLHDGEVFEKALEHIQDQPGDSSPNTPQTAGEKSPSPTQSAGNGSNSQPQPPSGGAPNPSASPSTSQAGGDSSQQNQTSPAEPKPAPPASARTQPSDAHPGSDPRGAEPKSPPPQDSSRSQGKPGKPGAGTPGEKPQNQGPPEGENVDRKKTQDPGPAKTPANEASPPSQSQRQSDSTGQSTGDRSGGGDQGAGQSAKQPQGNAPGSTSAGESGAGAAAGPGAGETGSSPGNQPADAQPTDRQGDDQGPGMADTSRENGNQTGASDQEPGNPGEAANAPPQRQPPTGGSQQAGAGQGIPTGGGLPGDGSTTRQEEPSEVPDSEAANLEYARKVTDMVLEYLDHQKSQPDEKLLNELGWTAEDLQRFLQRWRQMKQSALQAPDGQRQLEENLRSLGLRPASDRVRGGQSRADEMRGLRDNGLRSSPPSQYLEQFDAFKKGTARTRN